MIYWKIIFWVSFFIVFYSYVGYGIIVFFLVQLKKILNLRATKKATAFTPPVALIIAAYNEEDYILEKIKNTQQLKYPQGNLRVLFITDGSTDSTPDIIKNNSNYEVLHQPERKGKAYAMNRAVNHVNEDYLVFCDANTTLNEDCIYEIMKHYANEKVGGVAGEKKILKFKDGKAAAAGEGMYWKYESFLKKLDAELHTVVGAAGELFSVRKSLYQPIQEGIIIEDFVLTMSICAKGYVVKYEPLAYAIETASASMPDEQKRKVRIAAGGFQAMAILKPLLNIFKYGIVSFQYISHRVLRWSVCPFCLVILFAVNIILFVAQPWSVYTLLFIAQIVFYFLAGVGWFYANKNIKINFLYIPYYFVFMNAAVFLGLKRYIRGNQSVLWEKAQRQKAG
jgi:poly-beta-1,6-N-acetyl-D-glucosamine synthase